MANETLTDRELTKAYAMYEEYGPEKLGDYIRMLWGEAYKLGLKDGEGAAYVRGWNDRGVKKDFGGKRSGRDMADDL